MNLRGATVVVTGAATGVGRALAREAGQRGAMVVAVDLADSSETVDLIAAAGGRARSAVADVRGVESLREVARSVEVDEGRLDVLCANAGIGSSGTSDAITAQDLRDVLEVNLIGVLNTVQAFLPGLERIQTDGLKPWVLITGSEHSLGVPPHVPPMTAYTISKHAVLGLGACLRRDLAVRGIGVSVLCPGYVRTERVLAHAAASEAFAQVLDTYGQDGREVARHAFDAVDDAPLVLSTNAASEDFIVEFHRQIIEAAHQGT
jgi:NAD(P)-dependent dehydrogenase (short-subunit alcohol dehydrogenase family)